MKEMGQREKGKEGNSRQYRRINKYTYEVDTISRARLRGYLSPYEADVDDAIKQIDGGEVLEIPGALFLRVAEFEVYPVVCATCKKQMGEKLSSGVSHSVCGECLPLVAATQGGLR